MIHPPMSMRPGRVPLGRRVLFGDMRQGALTVAGVAAALLLVLVLDAVLAGALERVTYYLRTSPADVFVSQGGVRTMHMSASTLPADTARLAAAVPGAAWAAPIAFTSGALGSPSGRQLTYLVGYDTSSGRGGPLTLEAGVPPGRGEAVLDELVADDLGLPIGSDATVLGTPLKVAGLTSSGTSITNTTVFVSLDQFAEMRGATVSYVLVGAVDGTSATQLAAQVAAALPGTTVQTRAQFVAAESSIVSSMSADLLVLMNLIGLLIALAVVALGLLTSTLARLRDYAVLKAVGARTWELVGTVASQVLWTVGLALVLATGLALVLARLVPVLAPTVLLSVTPESVLTTGLGALAAGLIAALLPLLRLARVDAATAFRERQ